MKIFLDAGHNYSGAGTGAGGYGLREEIITYFIADGLKSLLDGKGHTVKMSRNFLEENVGVTAKSSINLRAKMANEWGADLFVSIHCNASNGKAKGTETLIYSLEGSATPIAKDIQQSIVSKLGTVDRGVKERPDLGVLRLTNCPSLLIETAFIDNMDDSWLLKTKTAEFAEAIADGIPDENISSDDTIEELTSINDIVWEYTHRGIVEDSDGMKNEMSDDPSGRLYWLARKTLQYMRERNV